MRKAFGPRNLSSPTPATPHTIGVCTPIRKYVTASPSAPTFSLAVRPCLRPFLLPLQYLGVRRQVITKRSKMEKVLSGQSCHSELFHPEEAAHSNSEQLLVK